MAFRIIREFQTNPLLMITCDHPNGCDRWASVAIESGHENSQEVQVAALGAFMKAGWSIGFSHRCTEHHIIERANEQRVIVPGIELVGRTS